MVGITTEQALQNSAAILASGESTAEDRWQAAQDWLESGNANAALNEALHATKLYPDRPEGWFLLGLAQSACDHDRAAESAFRKTFGLQLQQGDKPIDEKLILAQVKALQQRINKASKDKYGA